jgi:hypothetical protein
MQTRTYLIWFVIVAVVASVISWMVYSPSKRARTAAYSPPGSEPEPIFASSDEETTAYYTPWPESADRVATDLASLAASLERIEQSAVSASSAVVGENRAEALARASGEVVRRMVTNVDLESTIVELEASGLRADSAEAREALSPYFPEGRAMTLGAKLSPSSVLVRRVYFEGRELDGGFLGAHAMRLGPAWIGMNPLGEDLLAAKVEVVEVRLSAWAPVLVGGESEHHLLGLWFAWDSSKRTWLPVNVAKYVKLNENERKTFSASSL